MRRVGRAEGGSVRGRTFRRQLLWDEEIQETRLLGGSGIPRLRGHVRGRAERGCPGPVRAVGRSRFRTGPEGAAVLRPGGCPRRGERSAGEGGCSGLRAPPSGLLRGACEPLSPTAACGAAAGSGSPFPGLIAASWRSAVRRARPSPSPPCARCGCALISRKAALRSPVPAAPRARSSREDGKRSQCSPDEAAFGGGAAAGGCGLGWTPLWGRTVPRGSAVDAAASRGRCAVGSHRVSPEWGRGAVCVRSPSRLGALWWLYCCGTAVPQPQ